MVRVDKIPAGKFLAYAVAGSFILFLASIALDKYRWFFATVFSSTLYTYIFLLLFIFFSPNNSVVDNFTKSKLGNISILLFYVLVTGISLYGGLDKG